MGAYGHRARARRACQPRGPTSTMNSVGKRDLGRWKAPRRSTDLTPSSSDEFEIAHRRRRPTSAEVPRSSSVTRGRGHPTEDTPLKAVEAQLWFRRRPPGPCARAGSRLPVNGTIAGTPPVPARRAPLLQHVPAEIRAVRASSAPTNSAAASTRSSGRGLFCSSRAERSSPAHFLDITRMAPPAAAASSRWFTRTQSTPAIADYLAEGTVLDRDHPLRPTRETYDASRGGRSFDPLHAGIQLLRDGALPLKRKSGAVTSNRHDVAACSVRRRARRRVQVATAINAASIARSPLECASRPRDGQLDREDPARAKAWTDLMRLRPKAPHGSDNVYGLAAASARFAIGSRGR